MSPGLVDVFRTGSENALQHEARLHSLGLEHGTELFALFRQGACFKRERVRCDDG
jgi:hypothetical protein